MAAGSTMMAGQENDGTAISVGMNAGQVATSPGAIHRAPDTRHPDARAKRCSRKMARQARRKKHSRRRERTRRHPAKIRRRIAATRKLADVARVVAVEDLNVDGRNSGR